MNSPCIQLCQIDETTGLCAGCLRSLDEIAGWTGFSEERRSEIMTDLSSRRLLESEESLD
ncbi:DUF1289 domain-containing protein [uncultured Roseibium sp.]|uniref:DUF1289 domain-containing protein n=1 Tax=uncultured Roseibium sp. TaxID=1936171 RepID=UPI00262447B5|nr:DUF1289 domain-containing protein [uncultured Roseibium sp.]